MTRAILIPTALLTAVSVTAFAQNPGPQYPQQQSYYQDQYPADYPPQQQSQYAGDYQQQGPNDSPRLSQQDLSNLVAPIALYPDMLLSQVLAASTYPAEIADAQQWLDANRGLRGRQLVDAAKQQNWDPSVQALVAFPDVMNLLTRDPQWTTALGNAFLSQQSDVMDAIQQLRASAQSNGRLQNTPQQQVTYDQQNGQNAIVIQPTDPQVVYAPTYNPEYVWGPPAYGYYPSLGYPDTYGIGYGVGTFLGGLFSGFWSYGGWGWGLSWFGHGLFLNNLFFSHYGFHGGYGYYGGRGYGYGVRSAWVHDPGHRLGVPYGNRYAAAHFGGGYGGSRGYSTRGSFNGRSYAGSNYGRGGRQADAYRGLSNGSGYRGAGNAYGSQSRSFASNYGGGGGYSGSRYSNNYGSQGYRGQSYGSQSQSYRGQSYGRSYSAPSQSYRGGGFSSIPANNRSSSHGGFFSRNSEPKSSGHSFGGGGHSSSHFSGGGSHFGGGGGHSSGGDKHSSGGGGHHKH